jgi:hypothetical protein
VRDSSKICKYELFPQCIRAALLVVRYSGPWYELSRREVTGSGKRSFGNRLKTQKEGANSPKRRGFQNLPHEFQARDLHVHIVWYAEIVDVHIRILERVFRLKHVISTCRFTARAYLLTTIWTVPRLKGSNCHVPAATLISLRDCVSSLAIPKEGAANS